MHFLSLKERHTQLAQRRVVYVTIDALLILKVIIIISHVLGK
jgi:hypothetical protein